MSDPSVRHPIEELAEEFVERFRGGERPTIEEYCARVPEQADEVRELFPTLVLIEHLGPGSKHSAARGSGSRLSSMAVPFQIGDYRIVKELGRGGMGIVYEAEHRRLGRRVALKVLPPDFGVQSEHAQRFEREWRAAVRLHHPHIIQVYEVGVSEGVHFFAMQFIEGRGLDEVLKGLASPEKTSLPTSDRTQPPVPCHPKDGTPSRALEPTAVSVQEPASTVAGRNSQSTLNHIDPVRQAAKYIEAVARLGLQVAQALSHAHEQGVVHRDIKPSNLLLDRYGSVWVADFGLAKAKDCVDVTRTGDLVGTLRYMAPEQFHSWSDPRTDVCGLGLTLYELLTFQPAYDAESRAELIKQISHEEPVRPTLRNRCIPRELETIVLKAMEKEPGRRYQSAAAMADDLYRFLHNEPILARRITTTELCWRWCRNNPALSATTALLLLAFAGGFGGVFSQWQRAERTLIEVKRQEGLAKAHRDEADRQRDRAEASLVEVDKQRSLADASFNQARKALSELFDAVGDEPLLDEPIMLPLRKRLLDALLQYDRDFVRQRGDDPKMQAELAASFLRLASISSRSGARLESLAAYQKAIEIRRTLVASQPDELVHQAGLAELLQSVGHVHHELGQFAEAGISHEEAVAMWKRIHERNPADPHYRQRLASAYRSLGYLLRSRGEKEKALPLYEESLAIHQQLAQEKPDSDERQFNLAIIYSLFAVFKIDDFQNNDAEEKLTRSREINEKLVERHGDSLPYRHLLSNTYNRLGDVVRGRRHAGFEIEAWKWYGKAQQLQEELIGKYPHIESLQADLANTLSNTADVHRIVGDRDQQPENWRKAIEAYRKAIHVNVARQKIGSDTPDLTASLSTNFHRLAWCLAKLGQRDEAMAAFAEGIDHKNNAVERAPSVDRFRIEFAQLYIDLAVCHLDWGETEKSVAAALVARDRAGLDANILFGVARQLANCGRKQRESCGPLPLLPARWDGASLLPAAMAATYADQAINVLRNSVDAGYGKPRRLGSDEAIASLRAHPRYKAIVERCTRNAEWTELNKTIAARPDDPNGYLRRAALYRKLDKQELAAADDRRAIDLYSHRIQANGSDVKSLHGRGVLHLRRKQYDLAIADFSGELSLRPDAIPALLLRGQAFHGLGKWEPALQDFSRILELNPNHVEALSWRAPCYYAADEYEKAIADYHRILADKADDARANNAVAWTYVMAPVPFRDAERALMFAEKSAALAPRQWMYMSTLGTVQYRLGQWDKSIETMHAAIAANQNTATAFEMFVLAMSHHRRGDVDTARKCLEQGVEWVAGQPAMNGVWVKELDWLRGEAEEVMGIARK